MLLWLCCLGLSLPAVVDAAAGTKPNIIFFMADDLGWANVQWHAEDMKTPHSYALVKEGIELDRHYAFLYCSPSRTSLMTGRLPFHAQQINRPNWDLGQGAPRNMTFVASKLKEVGYHTHHVGKWHLGMSSWGHIPQSRGFDTSLVYFEGAEDHNTQRSCHDPECIIPYNASAPVPVNYPFNVTSIPYDLWENAGPAHTLADSGYNGYLFNDFAVDAIANHDTTAPLFMYLAAANSHTPLQAPQRFLDLYPDDWYLDRRQYAAMCSFWDEILGNVTSALKTKGMWDNTLLVFSSDNGGPAYWSMTQEFPHGSGANNWPLKGSKVSNWEGGTRVAAFVSGGLVPEAQRGTKLDAYIHLCDWYATFCGLAGVDPTDTVSAHYGLPPIDSMDMWPVLTGQAGAKQRMEIPLAVDFPLGGHIKGIKGNSSALIMGDWKLLEGLQVMSYYQGPAFPNASSAPYGEFNNTKLLHGCFPHCLYNIKEDPAEQHDVKLENFAQAHLMAKRLNTLRESRFQMPSQLEILACQEQLEKNQNFFGPWLP